MGLIRPRLVEMVRGKGFGDITDLNSEIVINEMDVRRLLQAVLKDDLGAIPQ
jgi:hypothetical protein